MGPKCRTCKHCGAGFIGKRCCWCKDRLKVCAFCLVKFLPRDGYLGASCWKKRCTELDERVVPCSECGRPVETIRKARMRRPRCFACLPLPEHMRNAT